MQSNMAATLNIDWVVDRAREAAELLGHASTARRRSAALDAARARSAGRRRRSTIPTSTRPASAGRSSTSTPGRSSSACRQRTSFLDLVRAVYEGLAFAARDCYGAMGHAPEEIRVAGGAARSPALQPILAQRAGARRCARARARRRVPPVPP